MARRKYHQKKAKEEGGVSVSLAELPGNEPVTAQVQAETAESTTSTNADSVIFTPEGSTPEETTPKAAFALPFRPAIPMDSVIEGLSSLAIGQNQPEQQQENDQQQQQPGLGPGIITKSKKRRMKSKEKKKQQKDQATSNEPKPTDNEKPSTVVARGKVIQLFDDYFGTRNLANWQRLCIDLGIEEKDITTVTRCKKVCIGICILCIFTSHLILQFSAFFF